MNPDLQTLEYRNDQTSQNLLVFRLGMQAFALSIEVVVQIIPMMKLTPLPQSDAMIEGVVNIRGKITPVMNVRRRLNMQPLPARLHTPIILIRLEKHFVGLIVDEVIDILSLNSEQVAHPDQILPEGLNGSKILDGVIFLESHNILLLNPYVLVMPAASAMQHKENSFLRAAQNLQPVINAPISDDLLFDDPVPTDPVDSGPVPTDPVLTDPQDIDLFFDDPIDNSPVLTAPISNVPQDIELLFDDPVLTDPVLTGPVLTSPVLSETLSVQDSEVESLPMVGDLSVELEPTTITLSQPQDCENLEQTEGSTELVALQDNPKPRGKKSARKNGNSRSSRTEKVLAEQVAILAVDLPPANGEGDHSPEKSEPAEGTE